MDISRVVLICVLATFANGQLQDGLLETGIGFIDGRQVRTDDFTKPRLGGRLSQNILPAVRNIGALGSSLGPFRSNLGPLGSNLGSFGSDRRRQLVVSGGLRGSLGLFGPDRLRSCRPNVCTLQFIRPRCRYTPVLRSTFGNYCLSCPEDICETRRRLTPRQRRRRRRIRRRLCRNFGICLGRQSGSRLGNGILGL